MNIWVVAVVGNWIIQSYRILNYHAIDPEYKKSAYFWRNPISDWFSKIPQALFNILFEGYNHNQFKILILRQLTMNIMLASVV